MIDPANFVVVPNSDGPFVGRSNICHFNNSKVSCSWLVQRLRAQKRKSPASKHINAQKAIHPMPPFLPMTPVKEEERFLCRAYSSASSDENSLSSIKEDSSHGFSTNQQRNQVVTSRANIDHGDGVINIYSSLTEASYATGIPPNSGSSDAALFTNNNPFDEDMGASLVQSPREVNQKLNLHLGLPWIGKRFERIRLVTRFMMLLFVSWWEGLIFAVLYRIPDSWLRSVILAAWNVYLPLHKRFLHRSTGLHPSVSLECHALSTFLYLIHFAVTRVAHIQYGLHILSAVCPTPPKAIVETIDGTFRLNGLDHAVSGRFLHYGDSSMTEYTLMWIYGGAFLSGDAHGNVGTADVLGQSCRMDVWIPDYRKAPGHTMDEILEDITCAYRWAQEKRRAAGLHTSKIVLVGWSAGAALCTRLMQSLDSQAMPKTAVLLSPFVRYEPPAPESSMQHYSLHDWLVTRNIMEVAEHTLALDTFWGNRNGEHSPLSHSMIGLPPLCVIVSQHEAVYDESCLLIEKARRDKVPVTVGVWQYMAHGWYMLGGLLPEGGRALEFASQFIHMQCDTKLFINQSAEIQTSKRVE